MCVLRFAFDQSESGEIFQPNHSANALKLPAKFQMISRELFQSLGGKSFFGPRPAFFSFFFSLCPHENRKCGVLTVKLYEDRKDGVGRFGVISSGRCRDALRTIPSPADR